jgi:hypothetical protein
MFLGGGHKLVGQHVREAHEALVVGGRELDGEKVGDEGAPVADHRSPVIHGTAHGGRDLHRLDLGLERFGEDTMNRSFESTLDTIEQSHCGPPRVGLTIVTGKGG